MRWWWQENELKPSRLLKTGLLIGATAKKLKRHFTIFKKILFKNYTINKKNFLVKDFSQKKEFLFDKKYFFYTIMSIFYF